MRHCIIKTPCGAIRLIKLLKWKFVHYKMKVFLKGLKTSPWLQLFLLLFCYLNRALTHTHTRVLQCIHVCLHRDVCTKCICSWEHQLNPGSVTWPRYSNESHCSPRSSQQGVHMLLSTTRPLCCCVCWERRGSHCIQRAPSETTEARVLLLLLAWRRGALGMEESFRFQKDFLFTQLEQGRYKPITVCLCVDVPVPHVFIIAFQKGLELFVVCVLFISGWKCRAARTVAITAWTHVLVCTWHENVYRRAGDKRSCYVTQSKTQFFPYVLRPLPPHNACPLRGENYPCYRISPLGGDRGGGCWV